LAAALDRTGSGWDQYRAPSLARETMSKHASRNTCIFMEYSLCLKCGGGTLSFREGRIQIIERKSQAARREVRIIHHRQTLYLFLLMYSATALFDERATRNLTGLHPKRC
jgi:hypothetical protein